MIHPHRSVRKSQICRKILGWFLIVSAAISSGKALALPYEISYLGRLTESSGKPLKGPIDLQINFYRSESGSDIIPVGPLNFTAVPLADGVFQINISLSPANFHLVFPDDAASVYIEVSDMSTPHVYRRQKYNTVPYALKVPVDGTTIGYNTNGKLTVTGINSSPLPTTTPADGQVLKWRTATGWEWGADNTAGGGAVSAGSIDTSAILDGSIINTDVSATAAIAGTKISPNFGAQNITTTGIISGDGSGLTNLPSGSLGTSIDGTEIAAGSIDNSHIAASAAISQSKISGLTTALTGKQDAIAAGTASQYWRGDKTWATLDTASIPENGNLYYTEARARGALAASAPLSYSLGSGTLSIPEASNSVAGYLSATDWNTFNSKQAAINSSSTIITGQIKSNMQAGVVLYPYGTGAGQVGQLRMTELTTIGSNYVGFKAPDSIALDLVFTLPAADGSNGQTLTTNGSGQLGWTTVGGGVTAVTAGSGIVSSTSSGTATVSLDSSGVTAGTYLKVTVDGFGRVTSGASGAVVSSSDIVDATISNADIATSAGIAADKIGSGLVDNAEFGYLDGVTGSIQSQLSNKVNSAGPTFTGSLNAPSGSATSPSYTFSSDNNTGFYSAGSDMIGIALGGAEKLRILPNGRVGINKTAPTAFLDVYGNSAGTGLYVNSFYSGGYAAEFTNTNGTSDAHGIKITAGEASSGGAHLIDFASFNGSSIGYIGQVSGTPGTIAIVYTSDRRLKENIVPTVSGLDVITRIDVRDYNYSSDPHKTKQQGFIAQDLYKVYPQAVSVGGEDPNKNPWGVDYAKLTPLLVKAAQELQEENARLKAAMDAKESEMASLKADSQQQKSEIAELRALLCTLASQAPLCNP